MIRVDLSSFSSHHTWALPTHPAGKDCPWTSLVFGLPNIFHTYTAPAFSYPHPPICQIPTHSSGFSSSVGRLLEHPTFSLWICFHSSNQQLLLLMSQCPFSSCIHSTNIYWAHYLCARHFRCSGEQERQHSHPHEANTLAEETENNRYK